MNLVGHREAVLLLKGNDLLHHVEGGRIVLRAVKLLRVNQLFIHQGLRRQFG